MNNYTVSIKSLILLTALALIFVLLTSTVSATVNEHWTREAVETGTSGDRECGKIGDADNDGDNEIISGSVGYIDMHEWNGATWDRTIIDNTLGTVVVYDLVIADVDNTERNKIAAALSNNTIFLYNWTGTAWECSVVSTAVDDDESASVLDLSFGNADDLGGNKIVASTDSGDAVMFKWTGSAWSRTKICDHGNTELPNVEVADCDNDESIEVLVCEEKGGYVYHYNDGAWALESEAKINEFAINVDVADADNTGCNKVVFSTSTNDIHMLNWTGSWTETTVTSGGQTVIYDIKIGDVYNDGTNRIVSGDSDEAVKIYTWNTGTSSWDSFTVDDAAGGEVLEVTSGDADNDGLNEIVIGTGGTGDDIYMYDCHFTISDVNADGPYEAGETISVNWSLAGSALATENYINVEYWDVTAGTQFNLTNNATSATSSTSRALTGSEIGHEIDVYVYTTSNSSGGNSTAITQGDPWGYTIVNTIQGPIITSCDSAGDEINQFAPGENVSVSGTGLDPNTNYTIWIQLDKVNESDPIVSTEDPSTTSPKNETVETDAEGNFSATLIWSIPTGAAVTNTPYDIVVDNQVSGTVGTYNAADDGLDSASIAGIVAPVPDVSSLILFASGLMLAAVCFVYGGRRKGILKRGER